MFFAKGTPIQFVLSHVETRCNALRPTCKTGFVVEVKNHKETRSSKQNNFYFANARDIATVLNDAGCFYGEYGLPYTSEIIHEINKKIFGIETTTKLSKGDFGDYMTKMFAFWIEKTHGAFEPKESPYSCFQEWS